jgi:hypothetical protein
MQYPYVHDIFTLGEIRKFYSQLKSFWTTTIINDAKGKVPTITPDIRYPININGKNLTMIVNRAYIDANWYITDFFNESERVKCRRSNSPFTPLELFHKHQHLWLERYDKSRHNIKDLRDIIYALDIRPTPFCALYPVSITLEVYRNFKPKRILDMSAGWGDRLIAATMYEPEVYVGVDPNKELFSGYNLIIKYFGNDDHDRYQMIPMPFEDVDLGNSRFDLMFTSPPYYDAEIYSEDPAQSSAYLSLGMWLEEFMFPSIRKIWAHLNKSGHLIFSMNDYTNDGKKVEYVTKVNRMIDEFFDSVYIGVVRYRYENTLKQHPLWIWRKV